MAFFFFFVVVVVDTHLPLSQVWCTPRSGGIARDWSGVPRKFKSQSAREERCACVQPASLDDPRLRPYDGCAPDTDFCLLPVADKKEE